MKISTTDKFKLINVKATFSVLKQQKKKFKFGSFGSKRKAGFGFHLLATIKFKAHQVSNNECLIQWISHPVTGHGQLPRHS